MRGTSGPQRNICRPRHHIIILQEGNGAFRQTAGGDAMTNGSTMYKGKARNAGEETDSFLTVIACTVLTGGLLGFALACWATQ